MLSIERPEGMAVIAHEYCAQLYQLKVVAQNIENIPNNKTRFIIISTPQQSVSTPGPHKCSIVTRTTDTPGALFDTLKLFAENNINLTSIESVPSKQEIGMYTFFLDFHGSIDDEPVVKVLTALQEKNQIIRILGCYPFQR